MSVFEYNSGNELMVRIKYDTDLIDSITTIAREKDIKTARFTAIGALKYATLGYYDQTNREYHDIVIDSPHEIASCTGNISLKEGKPFVHAHVVLADEKANTKAGHLLKGTVFAAEVHIRTLTGKSLTRQYDEVTGLWLWHTE